jgi:ABC-type sugar transport system permease subunit
VRGMAFYRGVYFLPVIVSWVAGSTMILWFIDPQSGGLALVMERLHLGSLPYLLQQPSTALPMVAATSIWKFVGYNAVIFLAGLQALSPELVDAAKVDGAGALRRFWYVTLPELRPITTVVIVLNLVLSLRLFDPIKVMTNGGPNFSTTTLVMYYYSVSWDGLQFGYGSAITLLLTALILFGAALQFAYFRFRGGES